MLEMATFGKRNKGSKVFLPRSFRLADFLKVRYRYTISCFSKARIKWKKNDIVFKKIDIVFVNNLIVNMLPVCNI